MARFKSTLYLKSAIIFEITLLDDMFVAREFPERETIQKLRNQIPCRKDDLIEWPDVLVHSKVKRYFKVVPESSFTILSVNGLGKAHITFKKKSLNICKDTFFIVKPFESFEYSIDEETAVEVLNFHLGIGSYQEVLSGITENDEMLLSDPGTTFKDCVFTNHLHFKPQIFSHILNCYDCEDRHAYILNVVGYTLKLMNAGIPFLNRIQRAKSSTKKELYRRMSLARDIIYSQYDDPFLTLDYLSRETSMSKYHFLRVFKQTFGNTPHKMIQQIRIRKISELLLHGTMPISEIALKTGIQEPNSIYTLLKKHGYPEGDGISNFE